MVKKSLSSKSGESIIEALVSLLILGMLMATIVSVIRFSMVMTGNTLADATAAQNEINNLKFDDYASNSGTFSSGALTLSNSAWNINAAHSIELYSDNGIIAFYPEG